MKTYFLVKIIKTLSGPNPIFLVLSILWTLTIAILCLVNFSKMPSVGISGADKYVHATFHFVFVILWFLALYQKQKLKNTLLKVLLFSIAFGILIELLQAILTKTRTADIFDVLANTAGAIIAVLALYWYCKPLKENL